MLSQNAVVKARTALEKGYIGTFSVTEHQKTVQANHSTGFTDVVVLSNQPCRLSFQSSPSAVEGDAAKVAQTVRLFFSPTITIKEGCKITVTQNGVTKAYRQSGTEAVYDTHKEIALELFKEWA